MGVGLNPGSHYSSSSLSLSQQVDVSGQMDTMVQVCLNFKKPVWLFKLYIGANSFFTVRNIFHLQSKSLCCWKSHGDSVIIVLCLQHCVTGGACDTISAHSQHARPDSVQLFERRDSAND